MGALHCTETSVSRACPSIWENPPIREGEVGFITGGFLTSFFGQDPAKWRNTPSRYFVSRSSKDVCIVSDS